MFTILYPCTEDEAEDGGGEGDEKKKKRQTRGGKGMIKTKKETAEKERKVVMSRASRGKKKYVTVVTGLGTFGKKPVIYGHCFRRPLALQDHFLKYIFYVIP